MTAATHADARLRARCRPARAWAVALWLASGGCGDEIRATLVALPGCGLEELDLNAVRVVPRGDFPISAATARVFGPGQGTLPELPEAADALTVEGQFGDFTVAVGRTARLDDVRGPLPVYFAPEDQLCALPSGVDFRDVGGLAVGPEGDVLLAGGRDRNGRLLDDVIHARDDDDLVTPLDRGLPSPVTGVVVVPTGARSFAIIGGARADGRALDHYVPVDLDRSTPVQPALRIDIDGIDTARGYHAGVVLPDGRILVTGGCNALDLQSRCVPSDRHVFATGFVVDPSTTPPGFEAAPPMAQKRYEHTLLLARDGTVLAVGGRNGDGNGVATIERWHPDAPEWTAYADDFRLQRVQGSTDGETQAIIGAALLEGGLLAIALSDGTLAWATDDAAGRWPGWCDGVDERACFHEHGPLALANPRRQLLALPGERLFADTWLLPFPTLAVEPDDAVDLSRAQLGLAQVPPVRRTATSMVALADGSVLAAGGRDPDTLEPVQPFLVRLRPRLDGPDENIPGVDTLSAGSLVVHEPSRVAFAGDRVELRASGSAREFPAVWAHVRSFTSASFRFDVTLGVVPDTEGVVDPPAVHVVLSHGAVARTSIRFGERIEGFGRDALGEVTRFTCAADPVDFVTSPRPLQIYVRPGSIDVRLGGVSVARCPVTATVPAAIGVGVSGGGLLTATQMKLTRI
ncbi:MAG: hypothetical protein IPH07_05975 [Deltaproteobacteria bacterium]|nr:hypothetical protein [Deltaproteobacteria bacterium]MBP7291360.1 hypothetical protein [Nannocystaceae bacterium]